MGARHGVKPASPAAPQCPHRLPPSSQSPPTISTGESSSAANRPFSSSRLPMPSTWRHGARLTIAKERYSRRRCNGAQPAASGPAVLPPWPAPCSSVPAPRPQPCRHSRCSKRASERVARSNGAHRGAFHDHHVLAVAVLLVPRKHLRHGQAGQRQRGPYAGRYVYSQGDRAVQRSKCTAWTTAACMRQSSCGMPGNPAPPLVECRHRAPPPSHTHRDLHH